jgi:hypothetical protein
MDGGFGYGRKGAKLFVSLCFVLDREMRQGTGNGLVPGHSANLIQLGACIRTERRSGEISHAHGLVEST